MKISIQKKLVYWGTGNICKICLKQYPDIRPDFFIDNNWNNAVIDDIPVKKPSEVENWTELFVVITTMAYDEVEIELKKHKLKKEYDYLNYKEFFNKNNNTIEESICSIQNYIENNKEYKNGILVFAPVFMSRMANKMICFFREYGLRRQPQKCVLLSHLEIIDEEYAKETVGYPVFNIPEICRWTGSVKDAVSLDESKLVHAALLTTAERKWIYELEERKTSNDEILSYKVTAEIYWYLKNIFTTLKPVKVVIWGGWERVNYVLAELAKRNGIPHGFCEYGCIPGTFQFARRGIAGQSEYAVEPERLLCFNIKNKDIKVQDIRNYIIENKIDTSKFRENEEDERNLQELDKRQKTVFFVGMDDYGMGINPNSNYWKHYVSSVVSSTSEGVFLVAEICKRNNWNFIFKPHPNPANRNELDNSQDINNIIQVKYMEIDRLIQLSDVVVSIASAVDYKTLIYGKPLVQLGYTTLLKKGCSYEVESLDGVEHQLNEAMEKGMTQEQNTNFELHMAQLLENYLWDDLSDRELRYGLTLDKDFFDEGE